MGDATVGLLPKFFGSPVVMGFPVSIIRILVGVKILFRILRVYFTSNAYRSIGTFICGRINNVGAIREQNALSLGRDVLRHAQRDREPLGSHDHGVSNPSVA